MNLLQQATAVADRTEVLGPIDDSPSPSTALISPGNDPATFARRRRNVLIGVGAGLAVLVAALLVLASIVSKIFGNVGGGLNKDELGLNGPSSSTSAPQTTTSAAAGSVVKPTRASVFSPDGDADNPAPPARRSTAIPPPPGRPRSTPTPCRSPVSNRARA
ncbi:virulence factor mvin family domain protein [Mycobacterium avium subsp. avium 2285 (R)]|nr:virulence factor mvin family domain protein [Mycobacterium avium subsp. avium 2285 (R)]